MVAAHAAEARLAARRYARSNGMIEFKNITKTYNSGPEAYTALRDISFSIDEGEFVAIMGPSGSGKSTLMHILGCLDTPTSGTYKLDNKDVSTMTDDELAEIRKDKIGFVFQSFNLLPRTTVLRNVILPLIYAGIPHEEREERGAASLAAAGLTREYFMHLSNQLLGRTDSACRHRACARQRPGAHSCRRTDR